MEVDEDIKRGVHGDRKLRFVTTQTKEVDEYTERDVQENSMKVGLSWENTH